MNMKRVLALVLAGIMLLGAAGVSVFATDNGVATIEGTSYATLQLALDAVKNNTQNGTIVLQKAVEEDVEVSCDVYVDLNGYDIQSVTVTEGTFHATDTATNDFESKSQDDYGVIASFTGDVRAAYSPDEDGYGYLMFSNDGKNASFHYVELRITDMTLRPRNEGEEKYNPSLYYKCAFVGDEVVADNVESFGVALSIVDEPAKITMDKCGYSVFTDFAPGANGNTQSSTLLRNVMQESNAHLINKRNAELPIYGSAYLKLKNAGYVFGNCQSRTLKEQVQMFDADWEDYTEDKHGDAFAMFRTYRKLMKTWDLTNINGNIAESDGVLRILGIGNSYTSDSMTLLNEVYKTENPDKKIFLAYAYYSGCTLAQHAEFIDGNENVYSYRYLNEEGTWTSVSNVTLEYIVSQQDWDLVSMQQGSSSSGRIDTYNADTIQHIRSFVNETLGYAPTYMWNMTWAWPVEDIEGDAFATKTTHSAFTRYYEGSQQTMYNMIVDCVQQRIVTDPVFEYLMPVGTAIQNARSSYLGDPDLHRDGSHVSDLGRLIASYVWYCTIENVTLDEIGLTLIPEALTYSYPRAGFEGDMPISDADALVIAESVKNAMAHKFQVTQSLYTEKPSA